jgi:hypothetical protein
MAEALSMTQPLAGRFTPGESVDDRVEREADARSEAAGHSGAASLRAQAPACLREHGVEAQRVVYHRREHRILARGV